MAHFCWCQIKLWGTWLGLGYVARLSIKPAHLSIKGSSVPNYILLLWPVNTGGINVGLDLPAQFRSSESS